jgi:hypothetical protein
VGGRVSLARSNPLAPCAGGHAAQRRGAAPRFPSGTPPWRFARPACAAARHAPLSQAPHTADHHRLTGTSCGLPAGGREQGRALPAIPCRGGAPPQDRPGRRNAPMNRVAMHRGQSVALRCGCFLPPGVACPFCARRPAPGRCGCSGGKPRRAGPHQAGRLAAPGRDGQAPHGARRAGPDGAGRTVRI